MDALKTVPRTESGAMAIVLAAGAYRFRCDVHTDMSGTLVAASGPPA